MPYRQQRAEADPRERVVPRLRSGSDPTEGVRRGLLSDEASLEAPWVHLALDDGSPLSSDEMRRDFASESAAFHAAIANLDPNAVSREDHGEVRVYRGEHAAEMLLSDAFLRRLHEDVGQRELFVAIPERGLLLAADQKLGQVALGRARTEVKRSHAEPLTSWVLRVERGRLRGRAAPERQPAPEPPRRPRMAAEPKPVPEALPAPLRPRPRPEWMPKTLGGQLAFAVLAICALFVLAVLRGATQRDDVTEITLPSPELLENMRESSDRFDREVDAVEVEERRTSTGTELVLTSDARGDSALFYVMTRMEREAERRAGDGTLCAIRGRLSPDQAAAYPSLDELAEGLRRNLREHSAAPTLEVTLEVAP